MCPTRTTRYSNGRSTATDHLKPHRATAKTPPFPHRLKGVAQATTVGVLALIGASSSVSTALASAHTGTRTCPVTLPNRKQPPKSVRAGLPPIPPVFHGNAELSVKLWPLGVIVAGPNVVGSDGSIAIKLPWWRGVPGALSVTAKRLGAHRPLVTGEVPRGYGRTGFQPSGIAFPTQGCWKITGRVGSARLVFVVLVVKATGNGY